MVAAPSKNKKVGKKLEVFYCCVDQASRPSTWIRNLLIEREVHIRKLGKSFDVSSFVVHPSVHPC